MRSKSRINSSTLASALCGISCGKGTTENSCDTWGMPDAAIVLKSSDLENSSAELSTEWSVWRCYIVTVHSL